MADHKHPLQPLAEDARGVVRFKENKIIRHLIDHGSIDLNALARLEFPQEDREQLAMLIGYSLDGFSTLSYVSDATYEAAARSRLLDDPEIHAALESETAPDVVSSVLAELEHAMAKFPTWPTDPLHALAVLGEEFGELTKATLQMTYEPHKVTPSELRTEAIQTAAMALRFLASLDAYRFTPGPQHSQPGVRHG